MCQKLQQLATSITISSEEDEPQKRLTRQRKTIQKAKAGLAQRANRRQTILDFTTVVLQLGTGQFHIRCWGRGGVPMDGRATQRYRCISCLAVWQRALCARLWVRTRAYQREDSLEPQTTNLASVVCNAQT